MQSNYKEQAEITKLIEDKYSKEQAEIFSKMMEHKIFKNITLQMFQESKESKKRKQEEQIEQIKQSLRDIEVEIVNNGGPSFIYGDNCLNLEEYLEGMEDFYSKKLSYRNEYWREELLKHFEDTFESQQNDLEDLKMKKKTNDEGKKESQNNNNKKTPQGFGIHQFLYESKNKREAIERKLQELKELKNEEDSIVNLGL